AGVVSYALGVWRARGIARRTGEQPHSRPGYYGTYLAIWTVLPALILVLLWSAAQPIIIREMVADTLPQTVKDMSDAERSLVVGKIASVAKGLPTLSPTELEIVKKARFGFATADDAQRVLQERGVALGSAPEPFVIAAAYDQLYYETLGRRLVAGIAAA